MNEWYDGAVNMCILQQVNSTHTVKQSWVHTPQYNKIDSRDVLAIVSYDGYSLYTGVLVATFILLMAEKCATIDQCTTKPKFHMSKFQIKSTLVFAFMRTYIYLFFLFTTFHMDLWGELYDFISSYRVSKFLQCTKSDGFE